MNEVARVRTPVPVADLLAALEDAARSVLGYCDPDALCTAWAQLVLEHGEDPPQTGAARSLRGLYCYNFGNRDATQEEINEGLPVFVTVLEHEDGPHGPYQARHVRRAYTDAGEGLRAWWWAMYSRWINAFAVMADPVKFAHELKVEKYYTGSEADYARALTSLSAEARRMREERG